MNDIKDSVIHWFHIGMFSIGLIFAAVVVFTVFRYPLRQVFGWVKERRVGGVEWYKIAYDGRKTNKTATDKFLAETKSFIDIMNRKSGIGPNKSFVSFLLKSGAEDVADGIVEVYVAVPANKITESEVKLWANGINCYAEAVDPPEIDGSYPSFALNNDYQTAEIVNEIGESRIGSVISALQPQSDNDIIEGTVILTIEPMSTGESGQIVSDATSRINNMIADDEFTGASKQTNLMKASIVRGMVASIGDTREDSRDILSTAMSRMTHLPVETKNAIPAREYAKMMPVMAILALIPYGIGVWLDQPAMTTVGIVCLAVSVLGFVLAPMMSNFFIERQVRNGMLIIPPYWRFSIRRTIIRFFRAKFTVKRNVADSDYRHTARPSVRQVLPMYSVPVLEYSTLPSSTTGRNVANTALPVIGYRKSLEQTIESHRAGRIVIGASSAAQPLARTLDTLEFGQVWGGSAGSGKTNGLMIDFMGVSRLSALGKTGPIDGRNISISPIWLETKSEGAYDVLELVRDYDPVFVEAHNPEGEYRLSIEGVRYEEVGNVAAVRRSSELFVDSMIEVYGKTGLGPRSKDILSAVHMLSLMLSPNEMRFLKLDEYVNVRDPNVIATDFYLIGGDANFDPSGRMKELADRLQKDVAEKKALAQRIARENGNVLPDTQEISDIRDSISRSNTIVADIGRLTQIKKDDSAAFGPIANKLNPMRRSEGMFDPAGDRRKITVDQIVTSFRPVIINMGAIKQDDGTFNATVSETASRELLTAFHFMLWSRISALCSGWKAQGKYVPIYADELIDVLPQNVDSENLIDRVRAQGRSKGCSHNVGFQSFSQMDQRTQETVKSFETRFFLKMVGDTDVEMMMKTFGESAGEIGADTLSTLKRGTGVARMVVTSDDSTMPFTFMTPAAEFVGRELAASGGDLDRVQESIYDELGL